LIRRAGWSGNGKADKSLLGEGEELLNNLGDCSETIEQTRQKVQESFSGR
jgi:hypothetical protein